MVYAGASIHEIAQVVAAAFQHGTEAGNFATISKLSRVMLLAPMVLVLGHFVSNGQRRGKNVGTVEPAARQAVPKPWFVAGFVAMMLFNSLDLIPPADKVYLTQATTFPLTVALAAMGLETDIGKLRAKGWKPLLVGAGSWLFIAVFSFCLIEVGYH